MLASASLGDNALRAQAFGKQCLADRIVDLVRAGVREIFTLEPDVGAPALTEPRRMRQRRRSANPLAQLALEVGLEAGFVQVIAHALLETLECGYQRLGNVATTERPEAAMLVGQLTPNRGIKKRLLLLRLQLKCHIDFSAARTALTNLLISS